MLQSFLTTGAKTSTSKNVLELIGLLIIFILILVVCYYTTRFIGNKQLKRVKGGNFELIETYVIAQNMYLQLICISGRYFVISVTKNSIETIAEIAEEDIVKPDGNPSAQLNFSEILSKLSGKNKE